MPTLGSDWWRALTPYLDQALEMPEAERAVWLQSLREESPALAAQLQALLDEHQALAQEGFLEKSPTPPPGPPTLAGQTIDAYTLVSLIGQGGMGSVWLAERNDGRFERRVAVKFLSIALVGRGGEERFKREGSILGRLAHSHIAELIDAGVSASGQPYLVLEHVDGEHIDQYCDQRTLDADARVRLFLDVLAAVEHAHANLIVHRDIKPSNVLVRIDGQVKLLDFGIAKLLEGEGQTGAATLLTRERGGPLTPEYAAPEQVSGGMVTTATDVYGLGVLLYVLLTGQHPAGPGYLSAADLVKATVDTEPPRMSSAAAPAKANAGAVTANADKRATTPAKLSRLLRGDLDTIVAKALKKDPQERYVSVSALADDLRRHLEHEPISARPDSSPGGSLQALTSAVRTIYPCGGFLCPSGFSRVRWRTAARGNALPGRAPGAFRRTAIRSGSKLLLSAGQRGCPGRWRRTGRNRASAGRAASAAAIAFSARLAGD